MYLFFSCVDLEKTWAIASEVSTRGSRVPTVAEDSWWTGQQNSKAGNK